MSFISADIAGSCEFDDRHEGGSNGRLVGVPASNRTMNDMVHPTLVPIL